MLTTKLQTIFDWIETHESNTPDSAAAGSASAASGASAAAAPKVDSDGLPIAVPLQLVATHPRRVFTDPELELKQLGLGRQILLIVEERDSAANGTGTGTGTGSGGSGSGSGSGGSAVDTSASPVGSPAASPAAPTGASGAGASPIAPLTLARERSANRPTSKLVESLTRQSSKN